MLVLFKKNALPEDKEKFASFLKEHCFSPIGTEAYVSCGAGISEATLQEFTDFAAFGRIIDDSFYFSSRTFQEKNTLITIEKKKNRVIFGGESIPFIGGPCSLESEEMALKAAENLRSCGVKLMRAMLFKPRTSPHSFQGLGLEGLSILKRLSQETSLILVSEPRDSEELEILAEYADIIQIGTRNMSNFQLLKAAASIGKPIILKRGMSSTLEEFLAAADYLLLWGQRNVILCERGIRTFNSYVRFTPDIAAIPELKELSHLPVIFDPSHASGKTSLVPSLALAGIAAGADGIMAEIHEAPDKALSDGKQSLSFEELPKLLERAALVAKAVSRSIE